MNSYTGMFFLMHKGLLNINVRTELSLYIAKAYPIINFKEIILHNVHLIIMPRVVSKNYIVLKFPC